MGPSEVCETLMITDEFFISWRIGPIKEFVTLRYEFLEILNNARICVKSGFLKDSCNEMRRI